MISLKACILEATSPSDQAKQLGLSYMGFGRWGKDGKVTHKTNAQKGTLEKVIVKTPVSKQKKQEPSLKKQSKIRPTHKKLVKNLVKNLPPSPTTQDVVQETTTSLGRNTPVTIKTETFLDKLLNAAAQLAGTPKPLAVYNPKQDAIIFPTETISYPPDIAKWDASITNQFATTIHEAIHAASLRIKTSEYKKDKVAQVLEEGLTEAIARSTTVMYGKLRSSGNTNVNDYESKAYVSFADAIDLVVSTSSGRITYDSLMATKTPQELKDIILPEMEKIVIEKLKGLGFNEEQINRIKNIESVKQAESIGMMLMASDIQKLLLSNEPISSLEQILQVMGSDQKEISYILNGSTT